MTRSITDNPVNRDGNSFCGPLVVAAILGCSTGHVATLIARKRAQDKGVRLASGKLKNTRGKSADKIRGTYAVELFAILADHGITVEPVDVGARYERAYTGYVNASVTRSVRGNTPLFSTEQWYPWTMIRHLYRTLWLSVSKFKSDTYIISTPGHWAIASDGKWAETFTRGEWVPLALAPKSRRKVLQAWRVIRPEIAGVQS
jgi:hypothetical protein